MVLWEATLMPMHGRTVLLAGTVVTQDIMPETALIRMRLIPKAAQILGTTVRIRARTRALESAGALTTRVRHGVRLHGSLPEVHQAALRRKATCGVVTMMSSIAAVEDPLRPAASEPSPRARVLPSYCIAALYQVLTEAMSVATDK